MPHVVLNPDGSYDMGLLVIVESPTGVTYETQCAGLATDQRTVEGFLMPVGGQVEAKKIFDWFWSSFKGNCYTTAVYNPWTSENVEQLRTLVSEIRYWYSERRGECEPQVLQLDLTRMSECVEAWIPVVTAYGRGILTLDNSD